MDPYNQAPSGQGPGGPMQPPPGPGPMGTGPMPGFRSPPVGAPATPLDIGRMASAVTVVAGIVVLFCSLLDLYSVTVNPGNVDDSVNGTVTVGMGFYSVVPFNAPVMAMAIPILLLVAALTAIPGVLGRRQGALVSAISALGGTLLGLIMIFANPLPGVELTGDLQKQSQSELGKLGVSTVNQLVDKVVDVGPGAGLIVAVILGAIASAAAGFAYMRSTPAAPAGKSPMVMPFPSQGPPPGFVPMPPPSDQFHPSTGFTAPAGPAAFDQTQMGMPQPPSAQPPTSPLPAQRPGAHVADPGTPGTYPGQS